MRKLLICLMICLSAGSYAYTRTSTITKEAEKIGKAEEQRKDRLSRRKDKLESELAELLKNYNSRVEITEKPKMDSEVRWYRDEYKKVLNQYDNYYEQIEKSITEKETKIEEIRQILEIMG